MTGSIEKILTPKEYADRHKKAFRVAYDFLNAHFPPEFNSTWWSKAAADIGEVAHDVDELTMQLLLGVWAYLEAESKLRSEEAAT